MRIGLGLRVLTISLDAFRSIGSGSLMTLHRMQDSRRRISQNLSVKARGPASGLGFQEHRSQRSVRFRGYNSRSPDALVDELLGFNISFLDEI